ncbi:hemerythrin domain-containing protein, partial [Klebsiella pneumoniae]|nr:hemerythrin domain-containing protein [Klebsiella pneumoniae]
NRISQTLHDEHRETVALMERLEQMLARGRRGAPDKADGNVVRLLSDLSAGMEAEVERHFAFEENHIFTYLEAVGDAGIGEHLTGE